MCVPASLQAANGRRVSGETGEHAMLIALTNTGSVECMLQGRPGVRLVSRAGGVLNLPQVASDQYLAAATPKLVLLRAGTTAYVMLAKYRCDLGDLERAARLQLTLPGKGAGPSLSVAVADADLSVCNGGPTDPGNSIAVTPIEASLNHFGP
jgi:hypothetical protein